MSLAEFEGRYGRLDRLLHRIAFRADRAQRAMADLEDALWRDTLGAIAVQDPVFVTALPRCGTSILLRLLVATGRFASHTYRDMPFVLCPLLWGRFSSGFAVDDGPKERAHGDGLEVSADSPEAFEEMIWKEFWPDHYRPDRIRPWTDAGRRPEFERFLERHMRKIVALRRSGPDDDRRYLSKNNLNIARLASRPGALADGVFVVPFREPIQHAASMLRQHRRFLDLHARDPFVREYMEAIGHHEFGRGLRPVDFGGWLDAAPAPDGLDFWLAYWTAAYGWILEHADEGTVLVSYRRLTGDAEEALGRLADAIGAPRRELAEQADRLRPPRTHEVDRAAVSAAARREARELFEALEERASV